MEKVYKKGAAPHDVETTYPNALVGIKSGPAGTITFNNFSVRNSHFKTDDRGRIEGNHQVLTWYYTIEEVPDSDDNIIYDSYKNYLKLVKTAQTPFSGKC